MTREEEHRFLKLFFWEADVVCVHGMENWPSDVHLFLIQDFPSPLHACRVVISVNGELTAPKRA